MATVAECSWSRARYRIFGVVFSTPSGTDVRLYRRVHARQISQCFKVLTLALCASSENGVGRGMPAQVSSSSLVRGDEMVPTTFRIEEGLELVPFDPKTNILATMPKRLSSHGGYYWFM
ncbi:hypothetical protein TNCV_1513801 [Trichonephila clavipes]|nr:hypothetical protein TNCV_1513801 [Trichonephila clavipes]